jgi:hypothetical protein
LNSPSKQDRPTRIAPRPSSEDHRRMTTLCVAICVGERTAESPERRNHVGICASVCRSSLTGVYLREGGAAAGNRRPEASPPRCGNIARVDTGQTRHQLNAVVTRARSSLSNVFPGHETFVGNRVLMIFGSPVRASAAITRPSTVAGPAVAVANRQPIAPPAPATQRDTPYAVPLEPSDSRGDSRHGLSWLWRVRRGRRC